MLIQFQYLIIAAIAMSISIYIVFLSNILDSPELAGKTVDKIVSYSLWFIIITASIVTKGMLSNSFIDRSSTPKFEFAVSIIILSSIILAALVVAFTKSVYLYQERYKLLLASVIVIGILPVDSFAVYYYGTTLCLVAAVVHFIRKCYHKIQLRRNLGLYFLILASSGVLVGVVLSAFFNTLLFNTFVLAILSLVILGFFVFYILFFHDHLSTKITMLDTLLYQDDITPLPNRVAFERKIDIINTPCYLGILNVNDFMAYNKLLGFDRGNQILRELAERLTAYSNEKVSFYRYYSDKFLIIFENMKYNEVLRLSQEIAKDLHDHRLNGVVLQTYIGLYYFDKHRVKDGNYPHLFGALETASSMAKNTNQHLYLYQYLDHEKEKNRTTFELKILDSIDRKLFEVYYQPQYNNNQEIVSFEALLRLQYDAQFIPVMDIISIAEKKGLMPAITKQVIDIVFRDICSYPIFEDKKVSINVSPDLLVDDEFKDYLAATHHKHRLRHGQIVLEMTETSLFNDAQKVNSTISFLKENGFEISIDDFGTGYSSIFRFSEHDVEEVKFDKIFIQDIRNPKTFQIMQKTIELFKSFNVRVVIEGVEETEQLELLRSFDIDLFQGYLFSRPLPIQELLAKLSSESSLSQDHKQV